jgi:hypothetical protein
MPVHSINVLRNLETNLPGVGIRTCSIFSRSAGYALFVLIIIVTNLPWMITKIVMNKVKNDSSTFVAPILSISDLYTLSMMTWWTNKFVSIELAEAARVASGAGFVERLCRYRRRAWRVPMRDLIILKYIFAVGSKLRIILKWIVVVLKGKV